MSRRLVDWKNSKTRLDQIDYISSFISKQIFNRPLPNLTQLRDTIDTVQEKKKSKPNKQNPSQTSIFVDRRITRNSIANMNISAGNSHRAGAFQDVLNAKKRLHSDSDDEMDAVHKKPRKEDSSLLKSSVSHSIDNSNESLSSVRAVSAPILPQTSVRSDVTTDIIVNGSVLSNSLNDFFSAFLQIVSLLAKNYSYASIRILVYYHEILKVLFSISFFVCLFFIDFCSYIVKICLFHLLMTMSGIRR
jgi:hypothetical protein